VETILSLSAGLKMETVRFSKTFQNTGNYFALTATLVIIKYISAYLALMAY
jgi:hypothetical protein